MRMTTMRAEVSESDQVPEGPVSGPNETSASWFRAAVDVFERQKIAADAVDVDEAYLRRMCSGLKPVNLAHVDRVRRANVVAYQRLVEAMARDGRMVVVASQELAMTADQRAVLLATRETLGSAIWPALRDRIAARVFGCGGDLLDHSLDYEAANARSL